VREQTAKTADIILLFPNNMVNADYLKLGKRGMSANNDDTLNGRSKFLENFISCD
jgi:hypothetical protein